MHKLMRMYSYYAGSYIIILCIGGIRVSTLFCACWFVLKAGVTAAVSIQLSLVLFGMVIHPYNPHIMLLYLQHMH